VAKFAILAAVLGEEPVPGAAWALLALLLLAGLAAIIALGRVGVRVFWSEERTAPRVRLLEFAPVAALLAACMALTIAAGPAMRYVEQAAAALHAPAAYIDEVLRRP
jgi:multicomponent K+:H+ antiporter subunit D